MNDDFDGKQDLRKDLKTNGIEAKLTFSAMRDISRSEQKRSKLNQIKDIQRAQYLNEV